eukprot:gnl/MRDRNA2_/MRDRNA2_74338_c0_seq1.p1 gnl/MRDRNA2_/MRDRNA2_74338_c0~~gnl/MRDRNA2_/MRDRNA2_74338_c0_seq1.p1  ORF type:complete len:319 (-),score=68.04 gnl/MRDRNA2_/MRDRNA2_74338_c0_seq1:88-930(-)
MRACGERGPSTAEDFMQKLENAGTELTSQCFTELAQVYAVAGHLDQIERLLHQLLIRKQQPETKFVTCMFSAYVSTSRQHRLRAQAQTRVILLLDPLPWLDSSALKALQAAVGGDCMHALRCDEEIGWRLEEVEWRCDEEERKQRAMAEKREQKRLEDAEWRGQQQQTWCCTEPISGIALQEAEHCALHEAKYHPDKIRQCLKAEMSPNTDEDEVGQWDADSGQWNEVEESRRFDADVDDAWNYDAEVRHWKFNEDDGSIWKDIKRWEHQQETRQWLIVE